MTLQKKERVIWKKHIGAMIFQTERGKYWNLTYRDEKVSGVG
jgi:hypothetical protein